MKVNCNCEHKGQDALYGKGIRIANAKVKTTNMRVTCTVCGKDQAPKEAKELNK